MTTLHVIIIVCATLFAVFTLAGTLAVIAAALREHFRGKRERRDRDREKVRGIKLQ